MNNPKVSVLMITYNHGPFVAQAIESALRQKTSFPYEIVIGEDYSSDGTRKVLEQYRARYPERIRLLLRDRNVGMLQNLAETLEACRGEYIAVIEGDDYWTSDCKIQRQVNFLDSHREYSAHAHNAIIFDEATQSTRGFYCSSDFPERLALCDLLMHNHIPTCSVMFRNGLIDRLPSWFFTLSWGDWSIHVLNARHGDMRYDREVMGAYRVHTGGVWSGITRIQQLHIEIRGRCAYQKEFGPPYARMLSEPICRCYFELARIHAKHGDMWQAGWAILKSLRHCLLNPQLLRRNLIKLATKLCIPAVHKVALRVGLAGRRPQSART